MAGTSTLKLVIDDKEYEASIKSAQQGMKHLQQSLESAGKTFNDCDKQVVAYARAIGQMETRSKTAQGKVSELSQAFVNLKTQYQQMGDAAKNSRVGEALAASIEQVKQRAIEAKKELREITDELNTGSTAGNGGLFGDGGISGMLQVFGGNLMTKAASMVANLGSEVVQCMNESAQLAKEAEGVQMAFERLGRGDILDGLRESTHGTVSDFELMKAAVKFNDFKLPLEELGTMLAFAQQKAKDTGQSVDYMVDSIVTGLGRKSLMILDNLGLSAAEVKEKMAETGDMTKAVGEIIREQMSKAGDYVETAADRAAQANAELQNSMLELGTAMRETFGYTGWSDMANGIKTELIGAITFTIETINEAKNAWNELLQAMGVKKKQPKPEPDHSRDDMNHYDSYQVTRDADGNVLKATKWQRGKAIDMTEYEQTQQGVTVTGTKRDKRKTTRTTTPRRTTTQKPAKEVYVPEEGTPDFVMAMQKDLQSKLGKEKDSGIRQVLLMDIEALKNEYQQMTTLPNIGEELSDDFTEALSPLQQLKEELKELREELELSPDTAEYQNRLQAIADKEQEIKKFKGETDTTKEAKDSAKAWQAAAGAMQSVGSALQSLEDPSAKIVGIIGQAVANIALGFAQATTQAAAGGPFAWIAAIAGGMATMVSTISAIHSATGYAEGGIVKGTTYSNDQIPAMLNAGEVVLNHSQVNTLANELQGTGVRNLQLSAVLSAEQIRLVLNNNGRRTGRGEYVTTNFRQ